MDILGHAPSEAISGAVAHYRQLLERKKLLSAAEAHLTTTLEDECSIFIQSDTVPGTTISLVDAGDSPVGVEARWSDREIALELVGLPGIKELTGLEHTNRALSKIGSIRFCSEFVEISVLDAGHEYKQIRRLFGITQDENGHCEVVMREDLSEREKLALSCYLRLVELLQARKDTDQTSQ